jgi:hypothetical protein
VVLRREDLHVLGVVLEPRARHHPPDPGQAEREEEMNKAADSPVTMSPNPCSGAAAGRPGPVDLPEPATSRGRTKQSQWKSPARRNSSTTPSPLPPWLRRIRPQWAICGVPTRCNNIGDPLRAVCAYLDRL